MGELPRLRADSSGPKVRLCVDEVRAGRCSDIFRVKRDQIAERSTPTYVAAVSQIKEGPPRSSECDVMRSRSRI